MTNAEPAWIRRYRAARVSLPNWAELDPDRLVYATNSSGVWQAMSWDAAKDEHHSITDKPTGVLGGAPTPDGTGVIWFDDRAGDEFGRFQVTPFDGGEATPRFPDVPDGWPAGLSLRAERSAIGVSTRDGGFTIYADDAGGTQQLYAHTHPAWVAGLSKDAAFLAIGHTEHGDVLHPVTRVIDARTGETVVEISDGDDVTVEAARSA